MSVADPIPGPHPMGPVKPRLPFQPLPFVLGAAGAAALLIAQYSFETWLAPNTLSAIPALGQSWFHLAGIDFTVLLVVRLFANTALLGGAAVAFHRGTLRQIPVIYHAPVFITCILAVVELNNYGVLESFPLPTWLAALTGNRITTYSPTFVTIAAAIGTELILGRLAYGKWINPASAYVSGISAGILLKTATGCLWPFVLCAVISIASKYALRIRGRHLWNPTNFGVTIMLLAAFHHTNPLSADFGNNAWPLILIWSLGVLILWKVGKLHIPVTFAAVYLLLSPLRSALAGDAWKTEAAPLSGSMYTLFMCFMITDPKTTTQRKWSQCLTAALIAVAEMLFRLCPVFYDRTPDIVASDAAFLALFIVGPAVNAIEILLTRKKLPPTVASHKAPGLAAALVPAVGANPPG